MSRAPLAGAEPARSAEPIVDRPEAKDAKDAGDLFGEGLARFDAGEYSAALPMFRQALDLSGSPNARLYVALCLRNLGQLPAAYAELEATVRTATADTGMEAQYASARDTARRELAALEPQVGKVIVKLTETVSAGVVTLNDVDLPPEQLGLAIPVTPGKLVVSTRVSGRHGEHKQLSVAGGETQTITLSYGLPISPEWPTPARQEAVDAGPKGPEPISGGGVRTAGFVVAGVGAASMIAFGVSAGIASSRFATLEEECGGVRCTDPAYADVVDGGKSAQLVANVALVAGAIGIAGGGLMILFGGPPEDAQPSATVVLGPQGGQLGIRGSF